MTEKRRSTRKKSILAALAIVGVSATVQAQELPIADIHMHAFAKSTPADIEARMDRNGVRSIFLCRLDQITADDLFDEVSVYGSTSPRCDLRRQI